MKKVLDAVASQVDEDEVARLSFDGIHVSAGFTDFQSCSINLLLVAMDRDSKGKSFLVPEHDAEMIFDSVIDEEGSAIKRELLDWAKGS